MLKRVFMAAVAAAVAGGCATYTPPPQIIDSSSFTVRQPDAAQDKLKDITMLTLSDAQRISVENNPTYIAAYYAVNAAKMRYYQALGAYSPEVTAEFTIGDQFSYYKKYSGSETTAKADRSNSFYTSTGLRASWLLFDGLSRYFSTKIAASSQTYYEKLQLDDLRLLMRSVAYAYNAIMLARENQRIALEDMQFQIKNLKINQDKYAVGAVALSAVLNFQIYVNTAESNYITAQYQNDIAVSALAVLMGYPEATLPINIQYQPIPNNFAEVLPSVETYLDAALANRPDLAANREQMKIAQYQVYQSYSAYSPTLSAYGSMSYGTNYTENNGIDSPFSSTGYSTWSYNATPTFDYGLQAQWTVFNGFIRYNRYREAVANLAISHYNVASNWIGVINEVRGSYANYLQSVKQAKLYEKTLDLTKKQRDLVQDEYDAGNTEITRLNEAQRDLVDAQTKLASAYITVQNAKAQLDAAVAELPASYYKDPSHSEFVPGVIDEPQMSEPEAAPTAPPAAPPAALPAPAANSAAEQKENAALSRFNSGN